MAKLHRIAAGMKTLASLWREAITIAEIPVMEETPLCETGHIPL